MTTPTHEELLKLAEEAGFGTMERGAWFPLPARFAQIERFAALLSAHQAQGAPVAEVVSYTCGSYSRNYKLNWLSDVPEGAKLYTAPPSSAQTDSEDIRNQVWNEAVKAAAKVAEAEIGEISDFADVTAIAACGTITRKIRSLKRPLQAQEPTLMCQTCGADRAKEACKGDLLKCGMMGAAQSASPAAQSGAVDERERSK